MSNPTFSEANKDFDPSSLSDEARIAYNAANKAIREEFADTDQGAIHHVVPSSDLRAGYKIEVMFGGDRTPNGPNVVLIQIWESGKRLNGGGDDKMYWCIDRRKGQSTGCGKPIPAACIVSGLARCPSCKRVIDASYLTGEKIGKLYTDSLATTVEKIFLDLNGNADIYCKYHPKDIRYQAVLREKGFAKARELRGMFIYPLKNILKDTAAGSTLHNRLKAFFSA